MDTTKTDRRRKGNRSEESRKAQTAAAVAASKQSRKTPREKGRENELKVLRWLADWGFTRGHFRKRKIKHVKPIDVTA